jgi:hypothetical protein
MLGKGFNTIEDLHRRQGISGSSAVEDSPNPPKPRGNAVSPDIAATQLDCIIKN